MKMHDISLIFNDFSLFLLQIHCFSVFLELILSNFNENSSFLAVFKLVILQRFLPNMQFNAKTMISVNFYENALFCQFYWSLNKLVRHFFKLGVVRTQKYLSNPDRQKALFSLIGRFKASPFNFIHFVDFGVLGRIHPYTFSFCHFWVDSVQNSSYGCLVQSNRCSRILCRIVSWSRICSRSYEVYDLYPRVALLPTSL